ncbi:MAG: hypothetical protein H6R16_686 [Proteobacteria bacterium]|nr:hypothetical protein [Pseudomonadota bacterium]
MSTAHVSDWVASQPLTASDVDCATAVMLKILDGKCKMGALEKTVMVALYEALQGRPGERFGQAEHALIATARQGADDVLRNTIYERRVLAETAISRPVMKAFKAMIRANGLFAGQAEEAGEGE